MIIGIKNKVKINRELMSIIPDAAPLPNFFDNLSTSGFKEHEITYEAKNNIAISFIRLKNTKNNIITTKKMTFFPETCFLNISILFSLSVNTINYKIVLVYIQLPCK